MNSTGNSIRLEAFGEDVEVNGFQKAYGVVVWIGVEDGRIWLTGLCDVFD